MRCYYFPIFHKGETQEDDVGELFGCAEVAAQYGARVARDIARDPDYDPLAAQLYSSLTPRMLIARHTAGSVSTAFNLERCC